MTPEEIEQQIKINNLVEAMKLVGISAKEAAENFASLSFEPPFKPDPEYQDWLERLRARGYGKEWTE